MTKNIIEYYYTNIKTDVAMNTHDAVDLILSYSTHPIRSVDDLDDDDKAKIALGAFEEIDRDEAPEALNLSDMNSDVISKLVSFLREDSHEARDALCDEIKSSFINYFKENISQALVTALEERQDSKASDFGFRKEVDQSTGESYYTKY